MWENYSNFVHLANIKMHNVKKFTKNAHLPWSVIVYISNIIFLAVVGGVRSVIHKCVEFCVVTIKRQPRISEVYSSNPADCLWCHIPLLEWHQRKTFQPLSCQEAQKMKMILRPVSVSSMGNTCLPFLSTVGYVPYNYNGTWTGVLSLLTKGGPCFFLHPWILQWVNGFSSFLLRSPVLSPHNYWPQDVVLHDSIFRITVTAAVCIGITMRD